MEKEQAFTSKSSYGYLDEWFDFKEFIMEAILKEHMACLMLSVSDCPDRENMFIEADIILERKWIFFFNIEKVIFDEEEGSEEERFIKDFLGI